MYSVNPLNEKKSTQLVLIFVTVTAVT